MSQHKCTQIGEWCADVQSLSPMRHLHTLCTVLTEPSEALVSDGPSFADVLSQNGRESSLEHKSQQKDKHWKPSSRARFVIWVEAAICRTLWQLCFLVMMKGNCEVSAQTSWVQFNHSFIVGCRQRFASKMSWVGSTHCARNNSARFSGSPRNIETCFSGKWNWVISRATKKQSKTTIVAPAPMWIQEGFANFLSERNIKTPSRDKLFCGESRLVWKWAEPAHNRNNSPRRESRARTPGVCSAIRRFD